MSTEQRNRIVILGAGFAGINVARTLARLLPREEDGEITVVDRNNFMLFTPMLTEVAGGQVDTRHIVSAVRSLSPRVTFMQGRVDGVDLADKRITVTLGGNEDGIPETQRILEAGQIVLALGSVTNYHGIPGVKEHSLAIKSVGDAAMIRNRALALLEAADGETDAEKRKALLTFVVGGGGFSGVETMAALNDLLRESVKRYPHVQASEIRTVLAHPQKRLLPEISAGLANYAQMKLQDRGVEVMLNTEIKGAGAGYVEIAGSQRIPTHMLVWTAGVTPSPVIGVLDCKRGHHGGVVVDECCAVPGHPGVWAIGDCAEVPQPGKKKTYAPTAQNATREGTQVAHNIAAVLRGARPKPFTYTPMGELAIVGKHSGVASVFGLHFSGLLAWAMWRAVYLAKMPLMGKRVRIGVDWALDLLFGREITEMPISRSTPAAGEAHG